MSDSNPHVVIYSGIQADVGGIERNIVQLIDMLSKHYRFTVLSAANPGFIGRIQAAGADFTSIRVPGAFSPGGIRRLANRFRNELRADLIHAVDPRGSSIACPAGKIAHIPTIYRHSVSPLDYENLTAARRFLYACGEAALGWLCVDAAIFVSERMRRQYVRRRIMPASRSHYIPNSVDLTICDSLHKRRDSLRSKFAFAPDEFVWINIGRITYQKAQDVIVDAAARLAAESKSRWRLVLVGDGQWREQIESQILRLNLSQRVTLTGNVPHQIALEILAASNALVFPSRYEGMPNTVLEAMALGIPVVVTDVGDSLYISGVENMPPSGLCVPVNDAEALAHVMTRIMQDSALYARLQAACRDRAAPFSVERTITQTAKLYEKLLSHRI